MPHGQTPTLTAFLTAVHPDDLPLVSQAVSAFLRGKTTDYQVEHRNLLEDGSIRWVTVHAIALRDNDGFPYRLVGTETDITDKRNAELALQAAKSELEERVEQRTSDLEQINSALKKRSAGMSKPVKICAKAKTACAVCTSSPLTARPATTKKLNAC